MRDHKALLPLEVLIIFSSRPAFVLAGAIIGLLLGGASGGALLGLGVGALGGYLLFSQRMLEAASERQARELERLTADTPSSRDAGRDHLAAEREIVEPPAAVSVDAPAPESPSDLKPATAGVLSERALSDSVAPVAENVRVHSYVSQPPEPSGFDTAVERAKEWLTTGNVPVKVGIVLLFFGVAFLFKYAVDNALFKLPIELRLLGVSVVGFGLFVTGWRLRERSRTYALNLQGGGIGLLYLTVFAAFRLYSVIPAMPAFALLVALTLAAGVLAVRQNARALAIMGSIGGFLAPVLASTGQGSHVALFSYYLVINLAIVAIAWHRSWRSLNLIGFLFTFGVGTAWGFQYYRPELFASTEPFLVINFLFYVAIAVLFALKQPPRLRGLVDGTIVFGTPVIAFSLQAQLVQDTTYGLAISAAAVAVFYGGIAAWLYTRREATLALLRQSFTVLAVGFATLAVPLALDDRWSAITWALEGAAVVWIGVRQTDILARVGGSILIVAAGYFYLEHGWKHDLGWPVLNGNVLGGMLIALAALLASRLLNQDPAKLPFQNVASVGLLIWGTCWWIGTGTAEIDDRMTHGEVHVFVVFLALSAALLAFRARAADWTAGRRVTYTLIPALALAGPQYLDEFGHLLSGWGVLSWLIAIPATYFVLWSAEGRSTKALPWLHAATLVLLTVAVGYEGIWLAWDRGLSDTWRTSAGGFAMLVLIVAVLLTRSRAHWPFEPHRRTLMDTCGGLLVLVMTLACIAALHDGGNPAPLPYVPLLNPFDALMVATLGAAVWFLRLPWTDAETTVLEHRSTAWAITAGFAFVLTTLAVVRGVHLLADVSWNAFALSRSTSVQAALSVYWALLGVAAMTWGTRRSHYWAWLGGVALMVVVVLKLFFVDLGNSGTLARIVSFLVVGSLLLVVGYFAPRPPRPGQAATEPEPANATVD